MSTDRPRDWLRLGSAEIAPEPERERLRASPEPAAPATGGLAQQVPARAPWGSLAAALGAIAAVTQPLWRASVERLSNLPHTPDWPGRLRALRKRGPAADPAGSPQPPLEDGSRRRWPRIAMAVLLAILLPALAFTAYAVATIPKDGGMVAEASPSAVFVSAADGQVFATRGVVKGEKLSPADLPETLKAAIIAIEDRRFRSHFGLDPWGMGRAIVRNAEGGREGASTITQQLARLTYLSQERSVRRKVQEAAIALWLEWRLSKDEILARYLNAAYFGGGAYGADAAARRFFGKPAKELDLSEAAMLAGLVRAPSQLAPHRNLAGARARAELVLAAMTETGAIKPEQAEAARRNPANVWEPPQAPPGTGYFADMVEAEARRLADAPDADLRVATTLDLRLQAAAERIVGDFLAREGRAKSVSQAAILAMAPDGAILAMVGGLSYPDSQFNRAVQAKRQAGSLFKLFVYLAAVRAGADAQSIMTDAPTQIGEWEPENYGGRYRGPVTLRAAFAASINTVAAQLAQVVGIDKVIAAARSLGVTSELPNVPSLALGSAEVTLLEMVRSYAAVAAGTAPIAPVLVRSLKRGDEDVTVPAPARGQPLEATARQTMLDLLGAVVREGTGRAARLPNVPVGGKTGTTQENRDAWFIGSMPDVTIGVWVGNDDNSPTRNVTGGDLPARIWRAVATEALKSRPRTAARERGRTAQQRPAEAQPAGQVRGFAAVRDTATLVIEGTEVHLTGIEGVGGREARDLARYIRRRLLECEPEGQGHRCLVEGQDLARLILFNGGARAAPDAPTELREAEDQAREARVGLWGGR